MGTAYISIGSNLGDRRFNLDLACSRMEEQLGSILELSAIYETEPWGFESSTPFLNRVVRIETSCLPEVLISGLLSIELGMGRIRGNAGYEPRVMDLDILLYEDEVIRTEKLEIPHPRMHLRRFVLVPLAEIAGEVIHPLLKMTINELLAGCTDSCVVQPFID